MAGLSNILYQQCRDTLSQCDEFNGDSQLQAIFVVNELAPFRNGLPSAASKSERIDACLAFLIPRYLTDDRPTLSLFLSALSSKYQEGDRLHDELIRLSLAVQKELTGHQMGSKFHADSHHAANHWEDWGEASDIPKLMDVSRNWPS